MIFYYYIKYNRPGAQKLLQLARAEGIQATSKQIKNFYHWQVEHNNNKKRVKIQNKVMVTL